MKNSQTAHTKKKDIKSTSEVGKIFFEEFNKRNNLISKERGIFTQQTNTLTHSQITKKELSSKEVSCNFNFLSHFFLLYCC